MKYEVQFSCGDKWLLSACNPVDGFPSLAEAALTMAGRILHDNNEFDFRIRQVDDEGKEVA